MHILKFFSNKAIFYLNTLSSNLCSKLQRSLPSSFANVWTTKQQRQADYRYQHCNNDDINIPFPRLSTTSTHPLYTFPKAWTKFTKPTIKILRDKPTFNCMLKKHFCDKLSDTQICNCLLCPSCVLS